ncbi:MAG: hypothetical protein NT116_02620 [Candidatus Parcubacteria bacterium]|nr:hypothetical protein [Candidatus Parcubacteria bacterium]
MSEEKTLQKLESIDKKLTEHDGKFDLVINKLVEHEEKLEIIKEEMATKEGLSKITDTLEHITTTVSRLDQERIFTAEWVHRVEKGVEDQGKEIKDMKLKLNIA